MHNIIIAVPGLVSSDPSNDILRELQPHVRSKIEASEVFRLNALPPETLVEANYLGVNPEKFQIPQGPITVSAFRQNPPRKSVHLHLSLASISTEGISEAISTAPNHDELAVIAETFEKLKSSKLIPVFGEKFDHALVWIDGSIENRFIPYEQTLSKPIAGSLPEGEGDVLLRRFIDDSSNILWDQDFNKRRMDEGTSPINMLWPWGPGFRPDLPNLALHRGQIACCHGRNLRLDGLARLFGYQHSSREKFGTTFKINYDFLLQNLDSREPAIIVIENIHEAAKLDRWEEAVYFWTELQERLLIPLFGKQELQLTFACWDKFGRNGLAFQFDSERPTAVSTPFDTRIIDDSGVKISNFWEVIRDELRS